MSLDLEVLLAQGGCMPVMGEAVGFVLETAFLLFEVVSGLRLWPAHGKVWV